MPEPSYKRKEPIVKIQKLIVLPLSLALIVLPLSACGTSSASSAGSTGGAESAAASTATTDFAGTYTYTTTIEQESVYGPVEKDVVAFEIELAEDGTATLTAGDEVGTYTDDSGTWEATSDTDATVTLGKAGEFTLTLNAEDETATVAAGTFSSNDSEDYELEFERA